MKSVIFIASSFFLFISCQKRISSDNCAQTSSLVPTEKGGRTLLEKGEKSYGGFLEIKGTKASAAETSTMSNQPQDSKSCTVFFEFEEKKADALKLRIWTARHCIKPPFTDTFLAHVFANQGYVTVPIELEVYTRFNLAKKEAVGKIDQPVREHVFGSFSPISYKYGFGRGKDAFDETIAFGRPLCSTNRPTEAGLRHWQKVCSIFEDISVYDASISLQGINETDKRLLVEVADRYFEEKKKFEQNIGENIKTILTKWKEVHLELTSAEREVLLARLLEKLAQCPSNSPVPNFCESREEIQKIIIKYGLPAGKNILTEMQASTAESASPSIFTRNKEKVFDDLMAKRVEIWESLMKAFGTEKNLQLYIHSNYDLTKVNLASKPGEPKRADLQYLSMPFSAIAGGNTLNLFVRDYGIIYFASLIDLDVFFEPGDSGSLISVNGFLPVSPLTSTNDKDTSGGAVLRPLPKPIEESKDSTKQQTGPGTKPAPGAPKQAEDQKGRGRVAQNEDCK